MNVPPDIDEAHESWGANCGPASLAALLEVSVASIRDAFPHFPAKPWTNITQMKRALFLMKRGRVMLVNRTLPDHGLAFLQFARPELPVRAQYRHTHWIAVDGDQVFDVSLDVIQTKHEWDTGIGAHLMDIHKAKSVHPRASIEVPRL